jgi:hypothetical protein
MLLLHPEDTTRLQLPHPAAAHPGGLGLFSVAIKVWSLSLKGADNTSRTLQSA